MDSLAFAARRRAIWLLACAAMLSACTPLPRLNSVPGERRDVAVVSGIPNARFYFDGDLRPFVYEVRQQLEYQAEELRAAGKPSEPLPPAHVLAISGGGDNGAFGAGLLAGWTASGNRPEFMLVTGVSAGALIAPFAFAGPQYDDIIVKVATSLRPRQVFRPRNTLMGLFIEDGMADSTPLQQIVERYVTQDLLDTIAREYRKGRYLQISTTDLDSGRAVQWNMGAIAASGAPGALELFRKVMVASTSIPGVVSPVMIEVEAAGRAYQEMHVDGGVITQVVTYPTHALEELRKLGVSTRREVHVYVIRNGRVDPEPIRTERNTISIVGRALKQLVQRQGVNDLERIYHRAQVDGYDYNVAYIGTDFTAQHRHEFDTEYMRQLFDYAYEQSKRGPAWRKHPPTERSPAPVGDDLRPQVGREADTASVNHRGRAPRTARPATSSACSGATATSSPASRKAPGRAACRGKSPRHCTASSKWRPNCFARSRKRATRRRWTAPALPSKHSADANAKNRDVHAFPDGATTEKGARPHFSPRLGAGLVRGRRRRRA